MAQTSDVPDELPCAELYALHASFCQGFSDPKRLLIIRALRDGEKTVTELWHLVGARQSTMSQHLALMRHLGLVESRRDHGNVFYRLADQRIADVVDLLLAVHADLQVRRSHSLASTA